MSSATWHKPWLLSRVRGSCYLGARFYFIDAVHEGRERKGCIVPLFVPARQHIPACFGVAFFFFSSYLFFLFLSQRTYGAYGLTKDGLKGNGVFRWLG